MPRYQLHVVKASNGENVRQPIVSCPSEQDAWATRLKRGEQVVAVSEINDQAHERDYPDGHPFEEKWVKA